MRRHILVLGIVLGCLIRPGIAAQYPTMPQAARPAFSPAGGSYASSKSVSISDTTPGATIYYTTDGTTPTTSSTIYSGPITVSSSKTLRAIAAARGYSVSQIASASYTIMASAAAQSFSVASGTYSSPQSVSIADAHAGATIYYTTDGTTPTTSSTVYSGPIAVSSSETLKAIAAAPGYTNSPVASATYIINPVAPDFSIAASPGALTVTAGQSGTTIISVTPENGFNSAISFDCSGLPAGVSCRFSPPTVTPSGAAASSVISVASSSSTADSRGRSGPLLPTSTVAVALCFIGIGRRRRFPVLLLLAASIGGLSLLTACSGYFPSHKASGTAQPVTSTVTVMATAGSLQHTATFSLTVN